MAERPKSTVCYTLPPGFESFDGIATPGLKLAASEVQLDFASQLRLPVFIRSRADRRPMVLIPGGTAIIGADEDDPDRSSSELPQRRVKVDPFYIDIRPLTVHEHKALQPGGRDQGPVSIEAPDTTPAVSISWEEATELARRLGKRLPTEVEWEHAAHGGTGDRYWWGFPFNRTAAICYSSVYDGPQPVGDRPANPFGLHDVLGNVWEWCED
ncbi:MAG: formylglycine-generating enzyme family protein, partial [bacterium]|nr:formylglycine-generating enzyme family protein [bacterium]